MTDGKRHGGMFFSMNVYIYIMVNTLYVYILIYIYICIHTPGIAPLKCQTRTDMTIYIYMYIYIYVYIYIYLCFSLSLPLSAQTAGGGGVYIYIYTHCDPVVLWDLGAQRLHETVTDLMANTIAEAKRYRYSSGPKDTEFWVKCSLHAELACGSFGSALLFVSESQHPPQKPVPTQPGKDLL